MAKSGMPNPSPPMLIVDENALRRPAPGEQDARMPPSAVRYTVRVIGIVLLGIVVVILMVGVSGDLVYKRPTDCAEQIAEWSVDETSHVDPGCR